jgi:hypothetical protein
MDGLKGAYKGAADEAAKQKPWETLNTVMGEIQEKIGEKLLPYMEDLATWLKDPKNQKKIDEWISDFGDFTGVVVDLSGAVSTTASEFGKLFTPLTKAWNALPTWLQNWIKDGMPIIPMSNRPRTSGAITITSPSAPRASSLYVTDEQVYRAVNQLILRGDTRNGRAQLAVP